MQAEVLRFIQPGEVRTRFAPSPTGFLHIGSARTCLFNYIFAKKNQGSLILRIEDTDIERSDPRFEKDILENLKWLGLEWDELYRQSERTEIYGKYLKKLLEEEKAYYCFCSEEELEAKRQERMSRGLPPIYDGQCRVLSEKEVKKNLAEEKKSIIRLKVPDKKIIFSDLVRGEVEFDLKLLGDFSLAKDINTPLYNFAVSIDDYEMKISHVIRGEDHLANTPKQILLQEALGFPRPNYVHLPLILGPDRSKLSKRHGAVSVAEFKKQGYLPETLVNFMAFLGWNPGKEREIYSMSSLIKDFSLEGIQKGGAAFNLKRLDFLNGFYLRQKSAEKLTELCLPYLIQAGLITPVFRTEQYPPAYGGKEIIQTYKISQTSEEIYFDQIKKIISLYQERLKKLSEVTELVDFFFKNQPEYDKNLLKWRAMGERQVAESLDTLEKTLFQIKPEDWLKERLEKTLILEAEKDKDRGRLLWPLRVALTGKKASAGPFEIAEILGKDKVLKRIKVAKEKILN